MEEAGRPAAVCSSAAVVVVSEQVRSGPRGELEEGSGSQFYAVWPVLYTSRTALALSALDGTQTFTYTSLEIA